MNTQKLKPFDLQAALAGKPVVTRDGIKVKEIHQFKTVDGNRNIVAIVNGGMLSYEQNGKYPFNSSNDLLMAPVMVKKWVNLYPAPIASPYEMVCFPYTSKEQADLDASSRRIACVEVEVEE